MRACFCWALVLLALVRRAVVDANQAGFCLQGAHNLPSAAADAQLSKGARALPPAQPHLAAYDWDLSQPAHEQTATSAYKPCHAEAPIFRYKAVDGLVYVDHNHHNDTRYMSYRVSFLEQLVLSMWLYKDFPNVDLVVDFTDHPMLCDQDIPFLRYSILNMSVLPDAQHYNVTELLAPAWVTQAYAARVKSHTRGFTIPSPEAWQDLSLSAAQLADFTSCLDSTHPWPNKQAKAFWRGQATGCSRGWPVRRAASPHTQAGAAPAPQAGPHLLRNKRVQMVLRLFPYQDQADVGLSSLPQLTPECLGASPAAAAAGGGSSSRHRQQQTAGSTSTSARTQAVRRRRQRRRAQQPPKRQRKLLLQEVLARFPFARRAPAALGAAGHDQASIVTAGPQHAGSMRWLNTWRGRLKQPAADHDAGAEQSFQTDIAAAGLAADDGQDAAAGSAGVAKPPRARAYRAVAALLHREGIGLEGWADSALTLSIDGYGPPFRLPQQLLLGSAVLRMSSPYQTWLDWHLMPGLHLQEFAYDLSDLEQRVLQQLQSDDTTRDVTTITLQGMAHAARALVAAKVQIVAQLDAFAWSVARYKEVCRWEVVRPSGDGTAQWHVLQLGADVFQSKGVPEGVQAQVMQHLHTNFERALRHPAAAAMPRH